MLFSFVISNNFSYLLITTFTWPRRIALINSCSISSSNKVPPEHDFFYPPAGIKLLPFLLFNAFCSSVYHPALDLRVPDRFLVGGLGFVFFFFLFGFSFLEYAFFVQCSPLFFAVLHILWHVMGCLGQGMAWQ